MSLKTNKSYSRRLKVTKTGKVLGRKPGKNHFNAREKNRDQAGKRGLSNVQSIVTKRFKKLFLPHEDLKLSEVNTEKKKFDTTTDAESEKPSTTKSINA